MVWLITNFDYSIFWNPWIFFFNDFFFIQFFLYYFIYLVFNTKNIYYILFYIFLLFFYFGLFLSLLNLDLFTAFLWLTETVVIFVSVVLLFYLNVHSDNNYFNYLHDSYKFYGFLIFIFLFNLNFFYIFEKESLLLFNNSFFIYDNFYESLNNLKLFDFFGLYVSYYNINSFEYLIIGFILLLASLVCVNLNKFIRINRSFNYYSILNLFDFFYDFIKVFFLKKQNLNNQTNQLSYVKILKKK